MGVFLMDTERLVEAVGAILLFGFLICQILVPWMDGEPLFPCLRREQTKEEE